MLPKQMTFFLVGIGPLGKMSPSDFKGASYDGNLSYSSGK